MDQIYQDRILAFARAARDAAPLETATHTATVSNPTCGDRVEIRLKLEHDSVRAASAAVRGCALCEAGAGLLMQSAAGRSPAEISDLRDRLVKWLGGDDTVDIDDDIASFAPVRAIRNRHKCVSLAFDASVKAFSQDDC